MLSPYLKRIIIDVFLFAAFAMGLFYAYKVFLDFLISLFHFEGTRNIPSIMYCIQRTLHILTPLIMLTNVNKVEKIKVFKAIFFAIGICYLLGNTWVIYYMVNNSPIDLIYGSIPRWFATGEFGNTITNAWNNLYAFQYNNAMVFNYLIWDSYDLFGILFSTIQGILYIKLAMVIDSSRTEVLKKIILISVLSLVIPWLYNVLILKRLIFSSSWSNRNLLLILESVFIIVSLKIAATSRSFWQDVLW